MGDAPANDMYVNITRQDQLAVAVYLTTVGIVATVGNISVLIILFRFNTFKKKSINFLLFNMAVSDLGVSFSGYPMTSASAYAGYWLFGDGGCQYLAFCIYSCSCSTIGSHTAIAVYRYIYVCRPSLKHKLTPKTTFLVLVAIWANALFWSVTPFLGWSGYTYEPFHFSCSLDWTGRSLSHRTYNWLCVFGVFVAPLAVMLCCYYKVAKRSNRVDPTRMEEKDLGVAVFMRMQRKDNKIDYHVTKMCILMTVSFVTAWTPYAVFCLLVVSYNGPLTLSTGAALVPTLFAKCSCMMNPLIYLIASSRYRRDFLRMFRAPCGGASDRPSQGSGAAPAGGASPGPGPSAPGENMSALYLRRTTSPTGDVSASMYFNKERIYIGDIKPAGIDIEAKLMKKDPDVLSMSSSNTSEYQVVVKETEKRGIHKAGRTLDSAV